MSHAPARGHYVIAGVGLISVDPTLGTQLRADIEIDQGRIVAVAEQIHAPGVQTIDGAGMIAMPGFVETHFHMWSTVGKNFISEGREYFDAKHATHEDYEPEDFYASIRLGLAEAANAGMTTVHNWDHNVLSPAHVDAELEAHAALPVRARYSYGFRDSSPWTQLIDFDDIDRVRRQWFSESSPFGGLLHLGVNIRPDLNREVFLTELAETARRGLPVAIHNGQKDVSTVAAAELDALGYLNEKSLMCHGLAFDTADHAAMARRGASLSLSPHSEMRLGSAGGFHTQLLRAPAEGVNVALSIDAASLAPIDMFEAMRICWNLGIAWTTDETAGDPPLSHRQVIEMATLNGARALGLDGKIGSITPGKRADVILVRQDGLGMRPAFDLESAVVRNAHVHDVDTVFVDGRLLKRGGELLIEDLPDIVDQADASAAAVRARAGGELAEPPTRGSLPAS